MAAPFVIPSIYTAIDRVTAPMRRMISSVESFAARSQAGIVRVDRALHKFIPGLSEGSKQMLNFARSAAIFAAVFAGINFTTTQVMAYEDALNSFRTIVSDLSNEEFANYRSQIMDVANDTRRSSVVVTQSFEKIAGLNADFAKTADGLGMVSKASITLGKAARMEMDAAAESLVGTMNQFQLAADQSDRVINVLAAGQAVGAASIQQSSESLKNFGSTAYAANISLEQTNALIQVMGKYSLFGAEAGTKLRGSVLKLQQAGVGYASGQFVLGDALLDVRRKMDRLATAKQKDALLNKVFGAENISTGRILLENIDTYKQFTDAVTGTQEAYKAAEINSNSLSNRITELQAKWVTMVTGTAEAGTAMNITTQAIVFLTDNMETITGVAVTAVGVFAAWKAIVWTTQAVTWVYSAALGINAALHGTLTKAIVKNNVALGAYRAMTVTATAVQWLWNAALTANPIGLVIVGIVALIAIIAVVVSKIRGWGEQWEEIVTWMKDVFTAFKLYLTLQWQVLLLAFHAMVDGIVLAWKWMQNKLGLLSDAQYAKDKAQIAEQTRMRVQAIKDTTRELAAAAAKVASGPEWKLRWANEADRMAEKYAADNVPFPARVMGEQPAPRLSTQEVQAQLNALNFGGGGKQQEQKVQIEIKDETGKARVSGTQGNPAVRLTPTLGQFG